MQIQVNTSSRHINEGGGAIVSPVYFWASKHDTASRTATAGNQQSSAAAVRRTPFATVPIIAGLDSFASCLCTAVLSQPSAGKQIYHYHASPVSTCTLHCEQFCDTCYDWHAINSTAHVLLEYSHFTCNPSWLHACHHVPHNPIRCSDFKNIWRKEQVIMVEI